MARLARPAQRVGLPEGCIARLAQLAQRVGSLGRLGWPYLHLDWLALEAKWLGLLGWPNGSARPKVTHMNNNELPRLRPREWSLRRSDTS